MLFHPKKSDEVLPSWSPVKPASSRRFLWKRPLFLYVSLFAILYSILRILNLPSSQPKSSPEFQIVGSYEEENVQVILHHHTHRPSDISTSILNEVDLDEPEEPPFEPAGPGTARNIRYVT
jgi:hypothetical protein